MLKVGKMPLKRGKGKIFMEPVRSLSYPVRSYTGKELKEFFDLDRKEVKKLRQDLRSTPYCSSGA